MRFLTRFVLSFAVLATMLFGIPTASHAASAPRLTAGAPDLIVSKVEYKYAQGVPYLRVTVKNRGSAPTTPFKVRVKGTGGGNINHLIIAPALRAGANFTFNHHPGVCSFQRTITVDVTNVVQERWMVPFNGGKVNVGELNNVKKENVDVCIT